MNILSIDTESCGIGLEFPLLSVSLSIAQPVFYDNRKVTKIFGSTGDSLSLFVKPDFANGRAEYLVQPEALNVNKIDLVQHDKTAITYKQAKSLIYSWLENAYSKYGTLTPAGHGVSRDIDIITEYTLSRQSWNNFVDVRVIDTVSLCKYLQIIGVIPEDQSISLTNALKFFNVAIDGELAHTAEYDCELNIKLLNAINAKIEINW